MCNNPQRLRATFYGPPVSRVTPIANMHDMHCSWLHTCIQHLGRLYSWAPPKATKHGRSSSAPRPHNHSRPTRAIARSTQIRAQLRTHTHTYTHTHSCTNIINAGHGAWGSLAGLCDLLSHPCAASAIYCSVAAHGVRCCPGLAKNYLLFGFESERGARSGGSSPGGPSRAPVQDPACTGAALESFN